jgi:hypothetical protein
VSSALLTVGLSNVVFIGRNGEELLQRMAASVVRLDGPTGLRQGGRGPSRTPDLTISRFVKTRVVGDPKVGTCTGFHPAEALCCDGSIDGWNHAHGQVRPSARCRESPRTSRNARNRRAIVVVRHALCQRDRTRGAAYGAVTDATSQRLTLTC